MSLEAAQRRGNPFSPVEKLCRLLSLVFCYLTLPNLQKTVIVNAPSKPGGAFE